MTLIGFMSLLALLSVENSSSALEAVDTAQAEADVVKSAQAQDVAERIDALLEPRIATREANGAVLVYRDGRELYRRYIGMADWEHGAPVTGESVFRIASLTKSFTAAAILRLAREGKLALTDPLAKFVPGFPNADRITIRNLLMHSAGLGSVPPPENPLAARGLDQTIASFADAPLAFEPGSDNRYSGAGYVMLAKVIEVASGRAYDDYLRAAIFEPLGMSRTGNFPLRHIVEGRAEGYVPAAGEHGLANLPMDELSPFLGEGSLESTPDDLMRWLEAVRGGGIVDLEGNEYPYGWGVRERFGRTYLEQTGLHGGFAAATAVFPEDRLSILCMFNVQSGFFTFCGRQLAAAVLGVADEQVAPSLSGAPMPIARADALRLEGVYRARPDLAMKVAWVEGGLHFSWVNEDRWQYLIPMEGGGFYAPSESAILTFADPADSIEWKSSFDTLTFARGK